MSANYIKYFKAKLNFLLRTTGVLTLLFLSGNQASATHNRAGEISFEQTGPLTLRVTLTTYTKTSSVAADRDSIEIFWGDGTSEFAVRANGWGDPQPNDVKINYYIATHVYPARATYTISMLDPNRVGGILNVNYPDSESVPFYLETTFTFLNTQFQGENNSAVLLQAPIDFGCVGEVFVHNPNAFDIDGDSLVYELLVPLQAQNSIVPDYVYPDQIMPGDNNNFSLDPTTGDLVWDAPQLPGEYNVAFAVKEYRQGVLINRMIRDMQIFILPDCENQPPTLSLIDEKCVLAGDTVSIDVLVDDPNSGQLVRVEASGAPFISTKNLAELEDGFSFKDPAYTARFSWVTSCEDISDQYYQIIFKAIDNGISDTSGLATLKTLRIKVMAPPPEMLETEMGDMVHRLTWNYPYTCAFVEDEYFLGFSIWRRNGSKTLDLDLCDTGLEGQGYQKIVFQHDQNDGIKYVYEDVAVEPGETYCYRVVPEFARRSYDGFPYNQVSGKPSNESCISLPLSLPYIKQVSVAATSESNGEIELKWDFPQPEAFDSLLFPGPYSLVLNRSDDREAFTPIPQAIFSFDTPSGLLDTFFLDTGLNTTSAPYYYLLELFNEQGTNLIGTSEIVSSVFISGQPGDNRIRLTIDTDVPWTNFNHIIYRKDEGGMFSKIAETPQEQYTDFDVSNGLNYCYLVQTQGYYFFNQTDILQNFSQEICLVPSDFTPPCAPEIWVENPCDTLSETSIQVDLDNHISWAFNDPECLEIEDLAGFNLYFTPDTIVSALQKIEEFEDTEVYETWHSGPMGLKGCYAVTAVDSSFNESPFSNIFCVDNCPYYVLPNVFTPNNDGVHDMFVPRINRHVYSVDMKIFNQWGQKVFETTDPMILWDGTNFSGNALAEGTYHYVCVVDDIIDESTGEAKMLSGFIQLIRGR